MEHFTKYLFNSHETEILGSIVKIIHELAPKKFNFCPIFSSQITLQISSREEEEEDNNEYNFNENKLINSHSINDVYGLYHHSFTSNSTPVIILCENLMRKDYSRAKFDKIRTLVLLHEIGHWLAYTIPFKKTTRKDELIRNPYKYSKDTIFHEFWAQAFCYKVLNGRLIDHNHYSESTFKYANSCIDIMHELTDRQSNKYKNYRRFQGDNSLNILEHTPFHKLFTILHETRAQYSTDFYHQFINQL